MVSKFYINYKQVLIDILNHLKNLGKYKENRK